jgi:hypothetical protein
VGPADVARAVGDLDEGQVGDQLLVAQPSGRGLEGEDPVGGAVDDERGHVELR